MQGEVCLALECHNIDACHLVSVNSSLAVVVKPAADAEWMLPPRYVYCISVAVFFLLFCMCPQKLSHTVQIFSSVLLMSYKFLESFYSTRIIDFLCPILVQ